MSLQLYERRFKEYNGKAKLLQKKILERNAKIECARKDRKDVYNLSVEITKLQEEIMNDLLKV